MLVHYLGKQKNQKFAHCMHVKHVSSVTFYQLSNRCLSNVMKISAKINTVQNNNILLFAGSLSINKVKNLTRWIEATWTKTHEAVQIVCKSLFTKDVQMSTICTDTCWRRFLHWSIAVSVMSCWKSNHSTIKRSFSSLRTVNKQKVKCWYCA